MPLSTIPAVSAAFVDSKIDGSVMGVTCRCY
jgi:hypothetical protein